MALVSRVEPRSWLDEQNVNTEEEDYHQCIEDT